MNGTGKHEPRTRPRARAWLLFTIVVACQREGVILRVVEDGGADADDGGAPTLRVRSGQAVRPISPLIYGYHFPDGDSPVAAPHRLLRPGLLRVPGFRAVTHNWEINASNGGVSWCHENGGFFSDGDSPGATITSLAASAREIGAALVITVPIGEHVAGDRMGGSGPPQCTGDVRKVSDYRNTRFVRNLPQNPAGATATPDVNDGAVYQDDLVAWLRARVPSDVPIILSLDRMPDRWAQLHPALFATPPGYQQLCERGQQFANAVRNTWPEAVLTGPVVSGWDGIMRLASSPLDSNRGRFIEHYLGCMKRNGVPLLDAFDFHWGSEAAVNGMAVGGDGVADELVRERVQAARSLWDPDYLEQSPIARAELGEPIQLIPRLRAIFAQHAPGVRLFLSEWSFGAAGHISGGIAVADALGVMGREGVGMAAMQWRQGDQRFAWGAFRMFRNYDGQGGRFGDLSVFAESSDAGHIAIYGSRDSRDGHLAIIIINRDTSPRRTRLEIEHEPAPRDAVIYRLTGASAEPVAEPALAADGPGRFWLDLPPLSVTLALPR